MASLPSRCTAAIHNITTAPAGSSTPPTVVGWLVKRWQPGTIGAFYAEITDGLKQAAAALGEQALFCGDPARQVTSEYYYAGGRDSAAGDGPRVRDGGAD